MAITYWIYTFGFSSGFYYDDVDRLRSLPRLETTASFLNYIFAGETGPFGRPLAMASFLLHTADWPNATERIFRVNTLVHLINGLLLMLLVKTIISLFSPTLGQSRGTWIAIFTGLLWLNLPLLASTSLIAIQRMTSLSATFCLIGLIVYGHGLAQLRVSRSRGIAMQAAGLGLGTILAILAKENGLLLPVFALVLELTLWRTVGGKLPYRRLRIGTLSTYLLAIVGYLTYRAMNGSAAYVIRDFSLAERVLTEPIILWDYLRQGFFPRTLGFSPFHDNYPKATGLLTPPYAVFALAGWLVLAATAIRYCQRWPVYAFAVLWFLVGHLLESTVLPLELYFEHRNYLPIIGPVFALVWLIGNATGRLGHAGPHLLVTYLVILWLLLWQTTSLWGDRRLAAEIWHQANMDSPRAAMNLAAYHANELGDGLAALRTFDATAAACPRCLDTKMNAVLLSCHLESPAQVAERMADIKKNIRLAQPGPGPVVLLGRIARLLAQNKCSAYSLDELVDLNKALLELPAFRAWDGPHRGLHFNLYDIALLRGDNETASKELQAAWQAAPGIDVAVLMVNLLAAQGKTDEARSFLAGVMAQAPLHPIVSWLWRLECESLTKSLEPAQHSKART